MQHEAFHAIEGGATVLTAGRRLARSLAQAYGAHQREWGRSVWRSPDILPLDAYLRRCWAEWLLSTSAPAPPLLLNPVQEQAVWESVIRDSPHGESLLRIPETARCAREAWALVQAWRLPWTGQFQAAADSAAFQGWAREFQRRCEARHWLEEARLSDFIAELVGRDAIPRSSRLLLAGFGELAPQQSAVLNALGASEELAQARFDPVPRCVRLPDALAEIRAAARWARERLEQNPGASIGVFTPELACLRTRIERIFAETLHPGAALASSHRSFHIALGRPLADQPAVHAAFRLLDFAFQPLTLPDIGGLLRSPFLGAAEEEREKRAALDARLRRRGVWEFSPNDLRDFATHCPGLQRLLQRVLKEAAKIPGEQTADAWSRAFASLLTAFGWPGERALTSPEYQVVEAWHRALSSLAGLAAVSGPFPVSEALDRLRAISRDAIFQTEDRGAPIQIAGLLEAPALRFDHVWVMGLHDEALPASARPNPFLPLSLQLERKLPRCSPRREFEFAAALLDSVRVSAPDLVFSYPARDGERELSPSPLLSAATFTAPLVPPAVSGWVARMQASALFESFVDEAGPPTPAQSEQLGGAWLFRDIAACPFRAFAQYRLGARPLDDAEPGLSARDKGKLVHRALEIIWRALGSQRALLDLEAGGARELVAHSVKAALDQLGAGIGRGLEQRRLEGLLGEWLEVERGRPPFVVREPEAERIALVGGIQVKLRVDRIDELLDGRQIILDYKTGDLKIGGWTGQRPGEPQLPLYCATNPRPMAGAAFVQIRTGDLGFRGVDESGSLPNLKLMRLEEGLSFAAQVERWKGVLESLGERFRAGAAEVDPNPGACEYCRLPSLCRIRELEND
jgi:ATP-dependent helicase/nuclease subunit B